jgi:hypothetical protein
MVRNTNGAMVIFPEPLRRTGVVLVEDASKRSYQGRLV